MTAITDRFVAQCSPVIGVVNDTCGSVTRASIKHLTATELGTLFSPSGLFADLDAWLFHSIEMKACGVRRYAMYEWVMANADMTKAKAAMNPGMKVMGGPSLMHPFIIANQESVVNRDHWRLNTTGCLALATYKSSNADPAAFPLTDAQCDLGSGSDRTIRVESRHGVALDVNWFRSRDVMHIFNHSSVGALQIGNWRVLAAAKNDAGTFVDLVVRSENAGSTQGFNAAPTVGFIVPGVNNVNDFESWCQNRAVVDPRKKVLFWYQTMRESRCIDEQYELVYERLFASNPAFREFGDLPAAQRNAQQEHQAQHNFVNAFFFQKPLPNQDKNNWESLEAINTISGAVLDPTGATANPQLIARRANFIGVREQLRLCDRVKDLQKNPLNLYEWLNMNYDIMRSRKSKGRSVTDIDWWCGSIWKANFQTAYQDYLNIEFGGKQVFNIEQGKVNEAGQQYDTFYFKRPSGVKINLITDEYFDDLYDENLAAGQEFAGNLCLCLDIGKPSTNGGSIYWAQLAANRREYKTADIQELAKFDPTYRCAMEVSHKQQVLTSQTGTVIVECPLDSLWIENFSTEKPIVTGLSLNGNATSGYQNLY